MRFQHGQLDENGSYHGYSYGLTWASIKFFFGVMITMVLIGFPLLVFHGPIAIIFEIVWIVPVILGVFAILGIKGSKGTHKASRREAAAVKPDLPVYDGDPPPGYEPPARSSSRSIGTKFQS